MTPPLTVMLIFAPHILQVVWFRNDLRLHDNYMLDLASKTVMQQRFSVHHRSIIELLLSPPCHTFKCPLLATYQAVRKVRAKDYVEVWLACCA